MSDDLLERVQNNPPSDWVSSIEAKAREAVKKCVHLAYGEAEINAALDRYGRLKYIAGGQHWSDHRTHSGMCGKCYLDGELRTIALEVLREEE